MAATVSVTVDQSGLAALKPGPMRRATVRALKKAGSTALRDMRSEASKRIRARKRIGGRYISRAISLRRAKGSDIASMEWAVEVSGQAVPLIAYPHRQTKRGVSVEVNRGKRTIVKGSFVATMRSGHEGVFRRRGNGRLPIEEILGSRPVDALMHRGEADAVAERGRKSFAATFRRVLPLEVGK